jgi:hypothetical protein
MTFDRKVASLLSNVKEKEAGRSPIAAGSLDLADTEPPS